MQVNNIQQPCKSFHAAAFNYVQNCNIHFSLSLPESYDTAQKYPMAVSVSGNSHCASYSQQDTESILLCLGDNAHADVKDKIIILTLQPWRDQPTGWNGDFVAETVKLIEHIMTAYAVDPKRVYALGSTLGIMYLCNVIHRCPKLFTAYAQYNRHSGM